MGQAERAGVRMKARRAQTPAGTARARFTTADPKGARPERKGILSAPVASHYRRVAEGRRLTCGLWVSHPGAVTNS